MRFTTAADIMRAFPGPVILPGSLRPMLPMAAFVSVASIVFGAGLLWMGEGLLAYLASPTAEAPDTAHLISTLRPLFAVCGWLMVGLGGCYALLILIMAALPIRHELSLGPEGFSDRWLHRNQLYAWRDVVDFKACPPLQNARLVRLLRLPNGVFFNDAGAASPLSEIYMAMNGRTSALKCAPALISPEELARAMNLWRARALSSRDTGSQ